MKLITGLIFFIAFSAQAEILEVHSLVEKESQPHIWIVKLTDGRVGFWNDEEDTKLKPSGLESAVIDATLSEESQLSGVRVVGKINHEVSTSLEKLFPAPPYTPTVYPTYDFATDVLRGMRRNWLGEAQCYDRAHVWAYDEFYFNKRYFQKAFLFFSDSYIGRYNYKWWFHTAPFALVKLNGETVERVMDPAFVSYPTKFKLWTDIFMKNKAECKVIEKYSDYSGHPGEDDCYIVKTSVYYWQPKDLDALERSGVEKRNFIEWELRYSYDNGFGIKL